MAISIKRLEGTSKKNESPCFFRLMYACCLLKSEKYAIIIK